ncbi:MULTISPECIES: CpcT/CpeT family chromophore lyase [Gammaproteobacteria]|uniref:CpcT/CpeT family chromophore lyase n=1 Tax=Gammaproteobacteria TaxID=1236 RepID=UPI000DCF6611|nr:MULTISPECIES: CpcT/CpeT family chromophore lyase [Gammaproteobacteria]RTE86028.1 hypothetical protein DQX04_05505 [Aliidiomarina sp. B3213]TCZ91382.1 hypothetical protein EYQ95_05515 [Lysobacter sp. N42]
MKQFIFLLFGFIFLFSASHQAIAQDENEDIRSIQKEELLGLLAKRYSNFHPLFESPDIVGNFPPIVQTGKLISLATGERVLLLEQSFITNVTDPFRRQLLRFMIPSRSEGILQITYPLPSSIEFEEESLSDLSAFERLPGCEVRWQKGADGFVGSRTAERCYFVDESGQQVHLRSQFQVNSEQLVLDETVLNQEGEPTAEDEAQTLLLEPIRLLQLEAALLPAGAEIDDADAWMPVQLENQLHDHGQRVNLRLGELASPYQIRVTFVPEQPNMLDITLFSVGYSQPIEQWLIEKENGAWTQTEAPLRFVLREQD